MMPVISGVDGYSNTPVSVKTRSGSFTYGFKSPELPVGTVLSVMVTHVTDPEYFHCQGTKYAAAFGHLADKIHLHYSKLQPEDETLKLISPGQPCVAQYSVDKLWYRAKVNRELSDGAVEVFFVDYGNVEVVARHLIKVTKPDFMEMPAQGILCTLDGISNVHGFWSPEHIAKFEDMVLEQFFTAKVKSFGQNGIHSVELSKEGENFQINLVFGRLTGTLCLEEDSDSSSRSVTVGRDRTNLQVTVESDSRNRRTPPKGWSMTKNAKIRRDGFQDADLLRDDGASSSDSQSFASCASDTSVCYKSFKFPIGSQLDVCMIFLISPHEFWCQPLSMGNKLKTLMKDLNDKNSGATRLELEGIPSSKTPCLAKFSDDRMWYRAEVVEVKQGKAAVFYVDYGNAEILPLSELRVLPTRYADVPTLAVKCCLNLDPKSVWSDSRINRMQELALDKRLSAKVVSRMAGTYVLELYDPNTQKNLVSVVEDKDLLHQLPINNDMNLRINVSWVTNPDDFWLHMANNERLLDNMVQEMQEYYDLAKEKYTECPSVGASVVAQFSEDNAWYRAIVEEVFDSKVRVRFVDFGNAEVISISSLRPLIPIFVQYPCQAVRCRLLDVKPLSIKGWTPDAKAFLENLDGDLICTFKKLVKNIFHVEIRQDGQSVAESMVNAGVAAPIDGKSVHTTEMNRQTSFRGLLNNFKVIDVLPNQVKSVMISHCNSLTDFWCQMAGFTDELNNMMDELAIEYDAPNSRSGGNRQFPVGSPCIAKYSEDDTWYRAEVVQARAGNYSVLFVDYGNTEEVNPTNMRQMTSKFMRLPKLAVPCKLYGICSSSAHQDDNFTELVLEKTMKAQFLNAHPPDGVYEVNLLQDDGVSVLDSLEVFTASPVGSERKMLGLSNGTLEIPIIPVNEKLAQGHSKIGSVCFSYSPDHFFIHFEEDDDKLDEASEMLNAEYSQDIWANKSLTHIKQGMICCAKYSVDDQWYRACVLENNGDTISLCFVDYGNSENVSAQNLRPLLEVFCDMPALAYKFGFAGILPMEDEWSQEVCDLFERIVVDETWTVRNMGNNECLLISDENGNNVMDLLVNSGHARKKDADFSTSKDAKATQPSSVLLPSKIYLDVIFEKVEDPSRESQSLSDILFIPDVIFPSVDVPSDEIQCCITHLTESLRPGIFYLRLASQDEKYSDLSMALCNKLTNYSNPLLEVNTICSVYLAQSKNMCRGVITSVDKSVVGLVDVKAIDSGLYLRDVPVSSIRGISDEARTVPPLAYPCFLENCPNWNERMRSRFHLLTNGRNLTAQFKSTTRPYIVELFDESGDKISDAIKGKMATKGKETKADESVLKPFHVLQHETLGIYISHIVTPEDFWCQPEESVDNLQKLEKEMSAYCTQGAGKEKSSDDLIKPGTLCIVHFAKDDQFYRGKVQSLKRFSCDILFIDYGYTETVEKKSIWPMQSEFLELPAQAFECRLAKIQSKDGSWSKNSLEVFQSLCLNRLMIARVINSLQHPDGTGYVIDLLLNQRNVADLLVEQNVAETYSKVELLDNVLVERSVIDAIAETHFLSSPKVLMKGESLRVHVCHMDDSPHKFWVQILTKVPLIERMVTLLGEVYGNLASKPASLTDLKAGMLCAVINSIECPYRGCVQNITDDDNSTCSVLNIDSGATETVECGCLKELYPCFMDFSPQAFHCELSTSDDECVALSKGWTGCLKVDAIADNGHYLVSLNEDIVSASLPMYLQPEYVEGFTTEAVVCFTTDPTDFWCQFKESAGLDYLMGKLKYLFKNDDDITIPESELRVGLPCVARYSEDGALYRAEVLELDMDSSSVQVMFCDYGNVEHIALSDLKPAPSELLTLPKQAFHCCLSDAAPLVGDEWTEDMRTGFEDIVAEKVFDLSILSVSNEDGKYMLNMKDKDEKCLLEMLIKSGIAKDPFSLTEADSKEQINSPNYGSAVELSTSEKETVDTDQMSESEEYKDISQASEEFGSEEFHDALHGNDPLKLADQNSNLKGDMSSDVDNAETKDLDMVKIEPCSVKQSNTMDSGLVADYSFSSENSLLKASSDLEDDNLDSNSNNTIPPINNVKDEANKIKLPEVTITNQKGVMVLSEGPSLELLDSNHNEWEDMDRDLKIENIITRLDVDGSRSFDLDSTFDDSDNETISPFTDWPLETGLRLKASMLHCTGPDHFYIRLCSMAEERVQLFSAIENSIPTLEPAQEKDFLTGSACLAKCTGDAEVWQRGIIQDEENGAVKIFFVDTGKEEKIAKNSVRRCPLSLFSQHVLAVSCFLADIQPLNGAWATSACDLFKELTHNVSLELKAELRSGGHHGIYLYKEGDDEAINDRLVDLGYASAETGSKLEVNRELKRSLLDPHRTEHMELSFHDISCCRESCYDDDFDCDTLDHDTSHEHILFEDSIKGSADAVTNITRLKENVPDDEEDGKLIEEERRTEVTAEQKKDEDLGKEMSKTDQIEIESGEDEKDVPKDLLEDEKDVPKDVLEDTDVMEDEQGVPEDEKDVLEDEKDVPNDVLEDEKEDEEGVLEDETDVLEDKKDVQKDVLEDEEDVLEDEEDVLEDEEDVPEDKKDVLEDEKDVPKDVLEDEEDIPEDNKDVPEDEEDVPEDEKDVPKDVKNVLEDEKDVPKDVLEDKEDVLEDEKDVLEDEKDVLEDEKDVLEDEKDVLEDEKDVLEDEKDVLEDEKAVPKDALEDEKDALEDQKGKEKAPQIEQMNEHQEIEKATNNSVLDD